MEINSCLQSDFKKLLSNSVSDQSVTLQDLMQEDDEESRGIDWRAKWQLPNVWSC